MTHVAVLDIGKTNVKLALVDTARRIELAVLTRPNIVLPGPPYPHYDVEGHWQFFLEGLAALHKAHGIQAISVTTHGASGVVLDVSGGLAAPVLDYEHSGPDALAAEYDALRPPFAETGTARMPGGLNLGAQLHWQMATDPGLGARIAQVVSYPGYWVHRLSGRAGFDLTSLGCHTDLWNPWKGCLSSLVPRLGLEGKIAAAVRPSDVAGPILPEISAATGLAPGTPVVFGIHDSNASLLPHLLARHGAFAVVSTGTWLVAMAVGGHKVTLDPARDTLVNVNALGAPTPSAKVMGGREYEVLMAGHAPEATEADARQVLDQRLFYLPNAHPGSGPWPERVGGWQGGEPMGGARAVAVGFYLALVAAECLSMIGADGPVVVEGPFARNPWFVRMLATATGRVVEVSASQTGTAIGAALLADPGSTGTSANASAQVVLPEGAWATYARDWRSVLRSTLC